MFLCDWEMGGTPISIQGSLRTSTLGGPTNGMPPRHTQVAPPEKRHLGQCRNLAKFWKFQCLSNLSMLIFQASAGSFVVLRGVSSFVVSASQYALACPAAFLCYYVTLAIHVKLKIFEACLQRLWEAVNLVKLISLDISHVVLCEDIIACRLKLHFVQPAPEELKQM